jgi:hypothetical protein
MKRINVTKLKYLGSGCECRCYAISERLVLKTYRSAKERDGAWSRQRKAYRAGVAPMTRGVFSVKGEFNFDFAYVSGRAAGTDNGLSNIAKGRLWKVIRELGYNTCDVRPGNWGKWHGKPVVIDFGGESLGHEHV